MSDKPLQERIAEAIRNPKNIGELEAADAVGTVGNSDCGELLRMWIKFKEENGRKVIDRATFQSFGCETAIAVASLATEMIRGKTAEEALSLSGEQLAADLGPLPPMKIHCSQLVESALRSALAPACESSLPRDSSPKASDASAGDSATPGPSNLVDSLNQPSPQQSGLRIVLLKDQSKE